LKSQAIRSFQSFLRSYTTHTKATRTIFNIKKIHLGHLAKSFALSETPAVFGKAFQRENTKSKDTKAKKLQPLRNNFDAGSEFSDGL